MVYVNIFFGCFLKYEYENCRSNKIWPLDKKVVQFIGHCLNKQDTTGSIEEVVTKIELTKACLTVV